MHTLYTDQHFCRGTMDKKIIWLVTISGGNTLVSHDRNGCMAKIPNRYSHLIYQIPFGRYSGIAFSGFCEVGNISIDACFIFAQTFSMGLKSGGVWWQK